MTERDDAPRLAYLPSRRRLLRDTAFVSLGLIAAACAPGATTPAGNAKKGGEFHATWPIDLPPKGVWNYYGGAPILGGSYLMEIIYQNLAIYRWADKKWAYLLAESHSISATEMTVKLRKGVKWDDGKDVTAKDTLTTFKISRLTGSSIWNFVDDIDAPDDYTMHFKLKKTSALLERNILRTGIRPMSVYGAIADKAWTEFKAGKTTADDSVKAIRKELADLVVAAPSSNGPYKVDPASLTEARLTLVKNPGGLFADKVNFDKIVVYNGDTDQVTPLILAGDVDYSTSFFPVASEKAFEGKGLKIVRGPFYTGPALYFHWENAPQFQDPKVRQAVAWALDRDEANHIAYGDKTQAPQWAAGVSDALLKTWLSADDQKKLTVYKKDTTKADGLMKDAGFARGSDGTWAKDGKKLEFDLQYPSDFADWAPIGVNISEQLNKWGVKITPRGAPRSTQGPDFNSGKFTLSLNAWGSGNPHPQPSMVRPIREFNTTQSAGGQKYPVKQKTSQGDVDFEALLVQAEDLDEAKQKDAVKRYAFAFNEILPAIPLAERFNNAPISDQKRVTGWPALDDPLYQNGGADNFALILLMDGTLGSK
ncbi:MAG TPA: ABC transporter substrate-binding protein [Candidatus Limnocylindria bacterium]